MIEPDRSVAATAQSNDALMPFERLLGDVSSRFIGWPTERIDDAINDGLRQIVETFGIDRSTLSNVDPDTGQFRSTHSRAAPGLTPVPATVSSRTYPWALARYRKGLPVVFSRLEDLTPDAALDRTSYAALDLRSHVGMPIMVNGEFVAVLGFGTMRSERRWDENIIARMRLIADLFGSALARKRATDRIDQLLRFERLLADLSVSLQMPPGEDIETSEQEALGRVAGLLGVDRAELWELAPASVRLVASEKSPGDGEVGRAQRLVVTDVPWVLNQLVAGHVVNSTAVDGLPAAAGADVAALRSGGVRSLLAIPLRGKDAVIGALTLVCTREERIWPDDVVPRLSLFGKLLLNAVALRESERQVALAGAAADLLRSQLAHASRVSMLGQLASALAHELSQPLGAILRNAEAADLFLQHEPPDLDELRAILADIRLDDRRAGDVIERLRALLKRGTFEARELAVDDLLANVVALARVDASTRHVRLEIEDGPMLPAVMGDPVHVQQVLLNLVLNSLDAVDGLPAGRRKVRVRATRRGEAEVELAVSDAGSGIAPERLGHLFEPFFTTKANGMGIGLSISRTIVEAHGGRIWAENNAGGGATFRFTLPVAGGAAPS